MFKSRVKEEAIFALGAVETLSGSIMSVFPQIPQYISYLLIIFGVITLCYSLVRLWDAIWEWLLNKAKERDSDGTKDGSIANLRASESKAIIGLVTGTERDKIIGLLQSGELNSWCMTIGFENLRPIAPSFWLNGSLEFEEIDGRTKSILAPFGYKRKRPWNGEIKKTMETIQYDVYFNKSQIKKFWPDLKL